MFQEHSEILVYIYFIQMVLYIFNINYMITLKKSMCPDYFH